MLYDQIIPVRTDPKSHGSILIHLLDFIFSLPNDLLTTQPHDIIYPTYSINTNSRPGKPVVGMDRNAAVPVRNNLN